MTSNITRYFGFCNKNIDQNLVKNSAVITKEKIDKSIRTNKLAYSFSSLSTIFYIIFRNKILNLGLKDKENKKSIFLIILGEIIFAVSSYISIYLFDTQSFRLKTTTEKHLCLRQKTIDLKYNQNQKILIQYNIKVKDNHLNSKLYNNYLSIKDKKIISFNINGQESLPIVSTIGNKILTMIVDFNFYENNFFYISDDEILQKKFIFTKNRIKIELDINGNPKEVFSNIETLDNSVFEIYNKKKFILLDTNRIDKIKEDFISEPYNYNYPEFSLSNNYLTNTFPVKNNDTIIEIDESWLEKKNYVVSFENINYVTVPLSSSFDSNNSSFRDIFPIRNFNIYQIKNVDSKYIRASNNKSLQIIFLTIFIILIAFLTREFTILRDDDVLYNEENNVFNKIVNKKNISRFEIGDKLYNITIILSYLIPIGIFTKNSSELFYSRYEKEIITCDKDN